MSKKELPEIRVLSQPIYPSLKEGDTVNFRYLVSSAPVLYFNDFEWKVIGFEQELVVVSKGDRTLSINPTNISKAA